MRLIKDKLTIMSGSLLLTLGLTAAGSTVLANVDTQEIDAIHMELFDSEATVEVTSSIIDEDGNEVVLEENSYSLDKNGNKSIVN